MANQTIRGLTASTSFPRTSVVPVAPTSGADLKTSGQQIVDMVNTSITSTFTTGSPITATNVVNGTIIITPTDNSQTYALPTASALYTAMGSPPLNTYVNCKIVNKSSSFIATLTIADADLLQTGLVSLVINSNDTFDLTFKVSSLIPVQITINGGSVGGDITGPTSSTANAFARYNGTTGKIVKNSSVTANDSGDITTPGVVFPGLTATSYTTATTITAASIKGGLLLFTPPNGNQDFPMDTAANIYAAMGSPALGTSMRSIFINKTGFQFHLNSPDSNLSLSDMPTQTNYGLQSFALDFRVTNLTPIQISVSGAQDTSFAKIFSGSIQNTPIGAGGNSSTGEFTDLKATGTLDFPINSPTTIYVSPLGGSDIVGDGTYYQPYQTVFYAESTITDASATKPYLILANGNLTEATRVAKPYVTVAGDSVLYQIFKFLTLTLHADWDTAPAGVQGGFENCMLESNMDLSLTTPPANAQFIINNSNVTGAVDATLGPQFVVKNTAVNSTITLIDTSCIRISSPQFGPLSITRSTIPVLHIGIASPLLNTWDITGDVDNIYDAISYKIPNIVSGTPTFSPLSIGDGTSANFTPVNYTPIDGSITGNLKGIDDALSDSGVDASLTLIWVDTVGVDAVGRGFYEKPYATISYAQTQITDASLSKPYTIIVTSNITDSGQIYSMPSVTIMSLDDLIVTTTNPIILHSSWSGTNLNKSSFNNIKYTSGISLDFTSAGATNPSIYFSSMEITPLYPTIIGYASGINPLTFVKCENCTGYMSGYDIDYTGVNNSWVELNIGVDSTDPKTGIIVDSFNEKLSAGGFFASGYVGTIPLPIVTSIFKFRSTYGGDGGNIYVVSAADQTVTCEIESSDLNVLFPEVYAEGFINFRITNSKIRNQLTYLDSSFSGAHISYGTDLSSYPANISLSAGFFNPNILDINYLTIDGTDLGNPVYLQVGRTYQATVNGENIYYVPVLSKIGGEVHMQMGDITGSIKIKCNLGQKIFFGSEVTTTGVTGFITMTSTESPHGSFTLRNVSTDSGDWVVVNCQGTIGVQE